MTKREKMLQNQIVAILKRALSPKRIILFGSRAKGRAHSGSDFDFAVDARAPRFEKKRIIQAQVDSVAGLHHVDLVFLSRVPKGFRRIIEETGRVLYER